MRRRLLRLLQPLNALGLRTPAAHSVRYTGDDIGTGIFSSRSNRGLFAFGAYSAAGSASLILHAHLNTEPRPGESSIGNQRNERHHKNCDGDDDLVQRRASLKKFPIRRNFS